MADIARNRSAFGATGIVRGPVTWYCYLLLAFFIFMMTIQGNVVAFLTSELDLSYRVAGLHASAIAVGAIVVGAFGDRIIRMFGRRNVLAVGALVCAAGAIALCLAPAAWASIAAFGLIGLGGSLLPTAAFAVLADTHRERTNVAINESSALNYGLAILAPLLTGLAVAMSLGWRAAVVVGAAFGVAIVAAFRHVAVPEPGPAAVAAARLPAAYWAYWSALVCAVALEFCLIVWSPAFLERVVGLPPAGAASAAAAFVFGMFAGRIAGAVMARLVAAERLLMAAFALTLVGFAVYWGGERPAVSVGGLFLLGLGVSLLFPITMGLAIAAAGSQTDAASARASIAFGIAILLMPVTLGGLADNVGLRDAHWLIPALVGAGLVAFAAGRAIERRLAEA